MTSRDAAPGLPTGADYLESLRDGREVWAYGERIGDVTAHPAFRNSARSLARLYDALHDPALAGRLLAPTDTGSGGLTHPFFKAARTVEELRASQEACRAWAELSYGWMGRSPDYKAAMLGAVGADPDWYGEYAPNARAWYRRVQEGVLYLGHAIVNPPVDRGKGPDEVGDVFVHVEEETDGGIVVSGAKVVATASALTQHIYVAHAGMIPVASKAFGLVFIADTAASGVKLFARASYEQVAAATGSPFDYPLSSRLDENDSILVFDRVLIPWENVLVYDVDKANAHHVQSDWSSRAMMQSATRMLVKLEFLIGLVSKALDVKGGGDAMPIQTQLGEMVVYRNTVAGLVEAMVASAQPHANGQAVVPNRDYAYAYSALAPNFYDRIRVLVNTIVASGLIYLNSNAVDFAAPEVRPYLDRYLRGSNGLTAVDRSKTMKLLWDAVGSEFGGRHALYERNYFGPPELHNFLSAQTAKHTGALERYRALVERCMADYDLQGWTAPDLIDPGEVSMLARS